MNESFGMNSVDGREHSQVVSGLVELCRVVVLRGSAASTVFHDSMQSSMCLHNSTINPWIHIHVFNLTAYVNFFASFIFCRVFLYLSHLPLSLLRMAGRHQCCAMVEGVCEYVFV